MDLVVFGFGYLLTMLAYILGGICVLFGGYNLWNYAKNPNGQSSPVAGIVSLVLAGLFLTAPSWGDFASQTVSGAGAGVTGTAAKMAF